MTTMNSEVYDALVDAGADETKAREAAKSVAQYDSDIAEIKASLLLLKWMVGFVLVFVLALKSGAQGAPNTTATSPKSR